MESQDHMHVAGTTNQKWHCRILHPVFAVLRYHEIKEQLFVAVTDVK